MLDFFASVLNFIKLVVQLIAGTVVGLFQIVVNLPRFTNYLLSFLNVMFSGPFGVFLLIILFLSVVLFIIGRK